MSDDLIDGLKDSGLNTIVIDEDNSNDIGEAIRCQSLPREATATESWIDTLSTIVSYGAVVKPRGSETKEILSHTMNIDMRYPVVYHPERKLNYKFMSAEAEFITNGDNRVCSLDRYNKNIAQFSDDGRIFNGNYGEPFNSQLEFVVRTLLDDRDSRQAVLTIFQANPVKSKDIRCTLSMQFLIRNGKIYTIVNMRSHDIIWGYAYDVFNFTIMTLRVLNRLQDELRAKEIYELIDLGSLSIHAGSRHLYDRHYDLADKILRDDFREESPIETPVNALSSWQYVLQALWYCRGELDSEDVTDDMWIMDPLHARCD